MTILKKVRMNVDYFSIWETMKVMTVMGFSVGMMNVIGIRILGKEKHNPIVHQ